MKKIIALILCIVQICGFYISVDAGRMEALNQNQIALLTAVQVFDKNVDLDKALTKGEFAAIVSKVAVGVGEDISVYNANKKVSDVKARYKYSNEINALYNMGCIKVDDFGRFNPEDKITFSSAVEMILKVLGYSDKDMSFAMQKNILDGIKTDLNGEVSVLSAYIMIYNMLNCDVTDLKGYKYITDANNLIYMSSKLSVYKMKGIVTDDGINSFYGETQIESGSVRIDNGEELINKTGRNDLLGLNIIAYVFYDKPEKEYHMLGVYENEKKNDITVLYSKNIVDFENRTYHYLEAGFDDKVKRISLPNDVVIIYNGKALSLDDEFVNTMFVPKNGLVKIYDNNSDGDADVIFIDEYTTYVAETYSINSETIYFKDEKPFLKLREIDYTISDKNGKIIAPEEIVRGNVLSVAESIDKSFYKIIVSTYTQEETVTLYQKKTDDELGYLNTKSGGKYILSDYATENNNVPELNQTYKFYFDIFDRVADYEKVASYNDWRLGYLTRIIYYEESAEELYGVKIFTPEGENESFIMNKKVNILDENDSVNRYTPAEVKNNLSYTGVIRYKLNDNGLITNIELPLKAGNKPDKEDRLFCILDTVNHQDKKDYFTIKNGKTINLGGAAVLTENTDIFRIPENPLNYQEYEMGNITAFATGQYYALCAYATDYKSRNAVCVSINNGAAGEAITNEYPETALSVDFIYDENIEEAVYKIVCMSPQGETHTYYMREDDYNTQIKSIAGNNNPVKLEKGDVFWLSVSGQYIKNIVLAYDANLNIKDEQGNDINGGVAGAKISYYNASNLLGSPFSCSDYVAGNSGRSTSWKFNDGNVRVFVGWVYSYEDGYITITNQNPVYGFDYKADKDNGAVTETRYLNKSYALTVNQGRKGIVSVARTADTDIKPYNIYGADCSRVVYTQRTYSTRSINIINKD